MNWKTLANKTNAKTYVLPPGWDSRETVARQLGCSEDRVDDHLRPALNSREVEKKAWPVWDSSLGRKVMVTAYHQTALKAPHTTEFDLARAQALKKAGKSYAEIGAEMGGISGETVRGRLRKVG